MLKKSEGEKGVGGCWVLRYDITILAFINFSFTATTACHAEKIQLWVRIAMLSVRDTISRRKKTVEERAGEDPIRSASKEYSKR